MLKIATYEQVNVILGSSLTPDDRCIDKTTAIDNGASTEPLALFEYNRLIPVEYIQSGSTPTTYYTITFKDNSMHYTELQTIPEIHDDFEAGTTVATLNAFAATATFTTHAGYTFTGWSPAISTVSGTQVYIAQYTANQHATVTLTFISDGLPYGNYSGTYTVGNTFPTIPNPTKSGYTFTGWNPSLPANVPNVDTTYTAQFVLNVYYDITFKDWDNTTLGDSPYSLQSGSYVKSTADSVASAASLTSPNHRPGWVFTGWSPAITSSTTVSLNLTYTAQYEEAVWLDPDVTYEWVDYYHPNVSDSLSYQWSVYSDGTGLLNTNNDGTEVGWLTATPQTLPINVVGRLQFKKNGTELTDISTSGTTNTVPSTYDIIGKYGDTNITLGDIVLTAPDFTQVSVYNNSAYETEFHHHQQMRVENKVVSDLTIPRTIVGQVTSGAYWLDSIDIPISVRFPVTSTYTTGRQLFATSLRYRMYKDTIASGKTVGQNVTSGW